MAALEEQELKQLLEEALWQVEEAKKRDLSISRAMNFINLSKEAQGYGNRKLAIGLITKARETLFNELVEGVFKDRKESKDAVSRMRLERTIKEGRERFDKGSIREAYDIIISSIQKVEEPECRVEDNEVICNDDETAKKYSDALDSLQRVWLKMKQEESKGKDMVKAKKLIKEAKRSLSKGRYDHVLELCKEITDVILSPQDRLREEVEETIDDITKTLRALFPDQPRSPKERFFKNQIEELISQSKSRMEEGKPVEAINSSRKAREILERLEKESIKGDIPKMIIELRASIDDLKNRDVDVSYEEYLLKQVEETFWKGEYIKARKIANKLQTITSEAREHLQINGLSTRLTDLDNKLKLRAGQEGYLQAREYIDKAKILMDQSAYDMASSFLDKAGNVLNN
jgi:RNase P protein component